MKIYEIKTQGEKEWLCANTVFQALKLYNRMNDLEISDFDEDDDIVIIPEKQWGKFIITDPDEEDENGNRKVVETFREFMERQTTPDFIASTVY